MKRFASILSLSLLALLFVVPAAHAKKKRKSPYAIKAKVTLEAGQDLVIDVEGDLAPCDEWECYLFVTAPKKNPAKEAVVMVEVDDDGSYQLRTPTKESGEESEDASKDEEKEAKKEDATGDDKAKKSKDDEEAHEVMALDDGTELKVKKQPENFCDPIELAEYTEYSKKAAKEGKEPVADSWKKLPVLTAEQRVVCKRRAAPNKTYETDEFSNGDPLATVEEGEEPKAAKFEKASSTLEDVDGARRLVIAAASLPEGDFDVSVNGYWGASVSGNKVGSASKTGVIRVQR
jgi:hypothetical protein